MNRPANSDHTFVVLAYKESEFLEDCIGSLLSQTVSSNIVIATSTDNEYIREIAKKHDLSVIVNHNSSGIAGDFYFGVKAGNTQFVTVAHQDDKYEPDYLEKIQRYLTENMVIAFTDYYEEHPDGVQYSNRNLKIKRLLLFPLRFRCLQSSRWIRRRILSLGNPICCPAVTYNRTKVKKDIFRSNFRSNMDWKAWEQLSWEKGRFVYIDKPLMMHRIHEASTTTEIINEGKRTNEDYEMMCLFWPRWIARRLSRMYANAEKNNH